MLEKRRARHGPLSDRAHVAGRRQLLVAFRLSLLADALTRGVVAGLDSTRHMGLLG